MLHDSASAFEFILTSILLATGFGRTIVEFQYESSFFFSCGFLMCLLLTIRTDSACTGCGKEKSSRMMNNVFLTLRILKKVKCI